MGYITWDILQLVYYKVYIRWGILHGVYYLGCITTGILQQVYYVMLKQFYHSGNYLNLTYLIWLSHPSSSVVRLPVDEPASASTMTHDHAKDLCASELGPLRI